MIAIGSDHGGYELKQDVMKQEEDAFLVLFMLERLFYLGILNAT